MQSLCTGIVENNKLLHRNCKAAILIPQDGHPAKDGIAGFTRVVAKELSKYGVTANAISPGANTRMTQSVPDSTRAMRTGIFKPAEEDHLINEPEDVAPVVAWLCTDCYAASA